MRSVFVSVLHFTRYGTEGETMIRCPRSIDEIDPLPEFKRPAQSMPRSNLNQHPGVWWLNNEQSTESDTAPFEEFLGMWYGYRACELQKP